MIYKRGCNKKGPDESCSKCRTRGSCGAYWYRFMWHGKLIRKSTKQGNDKVARQMEAAHKTSLAKGEVGIRDKKPAPTLAEFCQRELPLGLSRQPPEKRGSTTIGPDCATLRPIGRWLA